MRMVVVPHLGGTMSSELIKPIQVLLESLAASVRGALEWKWDGRFGAVLAEFSADRADELLETLQQHFSSSWDSTSVRDAPEIVQAASKKLGGLMPGQRLLISDLDNRACVFCAWWPWGNGLRISIRVAPFGEDVQAEEASAWIAVLQSAFEI